MNDNKEMITEVETAEAATASEAAPSFIDKCKDSVKRFWNKTKEISSKVLTFFKNLLKNIVMIAKKVWAFIKALPKNTVMIAKKVWAFIKALPKNTVIAAKKTYEFFKNFPENSKNLYKRTVEWCKEVKWKDVWDKCTTGILILLFCSPILILGYIFLWFILKA